MAIFLIKIENRLSKRVHTDGQEISSGCGDESCTSRGQRQNASMLSGTATRQYRWKYVKGGEISPTQTAKPASYYSGKHSELATANLFDIPNGDVEMVSHSQPSSRAATLPPGTDIEGYSSRYDQESSKKSNTPLISNLESVHTRPILLTSYRPMKPISSSR